MSLTHPNTPVSQQDLHDFYNKLKPYMGVYPSAIVNKFSKGDLYDTSEKMIGQWIDGKPLYQKSIKVENVYVSSTQVNIGSYAGLDAEDVRVVDVVAREDENGSPIVYYPLGGHFQVWARHGDKNFGVICDNSRTMIYIIITFQYTKTTDSAISIGSDTDYSTEEKIVGTWIDGKPLYQKTITGVTPSSSATQNIQIGVNVENALVVSGYCRHSSFLTPVNIQIDSNEYFLAWIRDNTNRDVPNTIGLKVGSALYGGSYNLTLQYTKTTT